jgi:light-harvesting complex I chlorophyll a/b binding protein 1
MRVLAFLSLIASVAAFIPASFNAPTSRGRSTGVMKMSAFADETGVVAPLGFWDPAGFCDDVDQEQFNNYRAIEIKHGRIAMLAMTHVFVTHFYKFPGLLSSSSNLAFSDVPSGLAALKVVPPVGWAQIIAFQAALEVAAPQDPEKAPGDVQPESERGAVFKRYDNEIERKNKLTKELNNGRLAMMAIAGTWASDALTNSQDPINVLGDYFQRLSGN